MQPHKSSLKISITKCQKIKKHFSYYQALANTPPLLLQPLRLSKDQAPFGLLVLASPDSQRYHAGMGTEFLDSLSALASAALQRLR